MTTKILALTDALGNLVRFVLLPGQRHDLKGVVELLQDIDLQALLADKAFDATWLVQRLQSTNCQVVIAQKANRRAPLLIDREMYKWRHLIENYFCKLKEFKRIALLTDYELRAGSFVQDRRGRWYLCVAVKVQVKPSTATGSIGIDLGLKEAATASNGQSIEGRFYRKLEAKLGIAQRAHKKQRVKALHAKIANQRKDMLHKFSTQLTKE